LGIITGILLHDLGLLTIVSISRKAMSRRMINWLTIAAGILLFGFAGYFIYEFVMSLTKYL